MRVRGRQPGIPEVLCGVMLLIFVAGHFIVSRPVLIGPDAHGYFLQTRLLAGTGSTSFFPESPVQYVGPHWVSVDGRRVVPVYGPGLALLALPGYVLGGAGGALRTNIFLALFGLLALFLLVRRLTDSWAALAVVVVTALLPIFNEQVHWGGAHLAVFCFFYWGLYLLAVGIDSGRESLVFSAGLIFGSIPAIRYPEGILISVFLLGMLMLRKPGCRLFPTLLYGIVGMALPLSILLLYGRIVYGGWFRTGYALTGEQTAFRLSYIGRNLLPYLLRIANDGLGLVAVPAAAALVGLWFVPERRRFAWLLVCGVSLHLLVYLAYYWPPDPMSMRFLLPTLPLYCVALVLLLRKVTSYRRTLWYVGLSVLLILAGLGSTPGIMARLGRTVREAAGISEVVRVISRRVPKGAVIVAGGGETSTLDYLGRWKLADFSIAGSPGIGPTGSPGQKLDKQIRPKVRNPLAVSRYAFPEPSLLSLFVQDCWKWAADTSSIWWLVPAQSFLFLQSALAGTGKLVEVDSMILPLPGADWPAPAERNLLPSRAVRLLLCRLFPDSAGYLPR